MYAGALGNRAAALVTYSSTSHLRYTRFPFSVGLLLIPTFFFGGFSH